MTYKEIQYAHVVDLIQKGEIFHGDKGNGMFRNKSYPYVLSNASNNLYTNTKNEIFEYFTNNSITWWSGKLTNHPSSSQVACLNHLFPIREDKLAVLAIVKRILPSIEDLLPILNDKFRPGFIQFEAISDKDHLNEKTLHRGSNCTSLDAIIYGVDKSGYRTLFVIEWKYTEVYGKKDHAMGEAGDVRKTRYTSLINESTQLIVNQTNVMYYEPFYQLMRQTLWAEQMIEHKQTETVKADGFVHIHVIPRENKELLDKKYSCGSQHLNLEETWKSCIKDKSKYIITSPEDFLSPINRERYLDLLNYLKVRYWSV